MTRTPVPEPEQTPEPIRPTRTPVLEVAQEQDRPRRQPVAPEKPARRPVLEPVKETTESPRGRPARRPVEPIPIDRRRFTDANRCPVCGGAKTDPAHDGVRCYGYLLSPSWAICTREERRGDLEPFKDTGGYRHAVESACPCGSSHEPDAARAAREGQAPAPTEAPERINLERYSHVMKDSAGNTWTHWRQYFRIGETRDKEVWWEPKGAKTRELLYGRANLEAADPDAPVYVVEGEMARDALAARGLLAVGIVTGAPTCPSDDVIRLLAGHPVRLWADHDDKGRTLMDRVEARRRALGQDVAQRIAWPDAPAGGDAADFFAAGGTVEQLEQLITEATPPPAAGAGAARPLAEIVVSGDQLRNYTREALAALQAWNSDDPIVFQQGDVLVRLHDTATQALTDDHLTHVLARAADWFIRDEAGDLRPTSPPKKVVRDIFSTLRPGLPMLDAFLRVPYFDRSGELIMAPGYNPETRIYLAPPDRLVVNVPNVPTLEDVRKARSLFDRMLCRFPFDSELDPERSIRTPSYANTLGAYLTPLVRSYIPIESQTPMFAFDAPALPGSGKTMLTKLGIVIASNDRFDPQPLPVDGEEMRKLILAEMLQGRHSIIFDNVKTRVENGALESILTSPAIRGRILGYTRTVSVPNLATWYITGNNLRFGKEALARSVWIFIDPKCEYPEDRRFEMQLPTWAIENRSELVSAALTMIRYWIQGGAKPGRVIMGRFEAWSATVGGILEAAEVPNFLGNRDAFRGRSDEESNEWRSFFAAWLDTHHAGKVVMTHDLARDAQEHMPGLMEKAIGPRGATTTLGIALAANTGRTVLGHRLTRHTVREGKARERTGWSLEVVTS